MPDKTLDCSDIDQYLGKPIPRARMKEPIANSDIRRWVQGMHYPNWLHYDDEFAAESRFGCIVAPLSFAVNCDDGHGSHPASVGKIPGSHLLFGGDEWWFYEPRIKAGDIFYNERIPYDYVVKETKFAGPTCFQRGDNNYYNQRGEKVATQRSTAIRYRADLAREMGSVKGEDDPQWTDEQLVQIETQKFDWIDMMHKLGHDKRYWDDVNIGDPLPTRVFGPHSICSLTTEWRSYIFTMWGSMHRRTDLSMEALGFTGPMAEPEYDPVVEKMNPEKTDGAYVGPSRGHLFPRWARYIGMPRGYGYGASMGAWITDFFSAWAGEWGSVIHSNCAYRGPAFTGDITIMTGAVRDKKIDDQGRAIVMVDCRMSNQLDNVMATAKAEVKLPKK
jgi:hypothetical protein